MLERNNTISNYWFKAEFKTERGKFFACRWDEKEGLYVLRPFVGGKEIRLAVHHLNEQVQLLGLISRKSAKERGIEHLLKGGQTYIAS